MLFLAAAAVAVAAAHVSPRALTAAALLAPAAWASPFALVLELVLAPCAPVVRAVALVLLVR